MAMAALLISLTAVAHSEAAFAAIHGHATGTELLSSATWAAVATQSVTPAPTALALSFGISLLFAPPPQYFDVVNTGTRTLDGAAYLVSLSGLSLGSTSVTLQACAIGVSWNTSTGVCQSGTATTIGSFTSSSTTYLASTVAPTTAGTRLHVQASVSGALLSVLSATVNAEVTSLSPQDYLPLTANH